MTIDIGQIDKDVDSFGQWVVKTNLIINALSNSILTTNSGNTVGNSVITGTLFANVFHANNLLKVGNTSSNVVLTNDKMIVYDSSTVNTTITSNGMIINGSVLYKSNIMQMGSSVIRNANVTSDVGTFNERISSGNSIMYPAYIQADAVNTYAFSLQTLSIGDIEANVQYDRDGYKITSNPTGELEEQSLMNSTDLYVKYIHCTDIESTGTATVNDLIINGNFSLNPGGGAGADIKFNSNVLFYGIKNFFASGLTSNGNVGIGIGAGKEFNAVAPLHISKSSPGSGLQTYNNKSSAIFESGDDNLIEFRYPVNTGKYAGFTWSDNNQGGYLVYQNQGGGVGGSYTDRFRIGAVSGINFEIGASNSTDGIAADRRIVLSATNSDIEISTTNGIKLYGTTSGSASIVAHPTATITKFTLPVNGGASGQALATNGTGAMYWKDVSYVTPTTDLRIQSLGVNCEAGATGTIRATGDIVGFFSSDRSLKTNVKPIENALDKIEKLTGVEFDWNDDFIAQNGGEDGYFIKRHDIGVIAQDIEPVLPEVVGTRPDGIKAVKYDRIVALLIQGINELKAEVRELKSNACDCGCKK
jgi:hypothetical protein